METRRQKQLREWDEEMYASQGELPFKPGHFAEFRRKSLRQFRRKKIRSHRWYEWFRSHPDYKRDEEGVPF